MPGTKQPEGVHEQLILLTRVIVLISERQSEALVGHGRREATRLGPTIWHEAVSCGTIAGAEDG